MTLTHRTPTASVTRAFGSTFEALCASEAGAAGGETAGALAKIAIFSTFFPLGLRTIQWLQNGIWPVLNLDSLGLSPPWVPWVGAQQLLHNVYRLPVEFLSIAFCGTIYIVAAMLLDRHRTAKRQRPGTI